MIRTIRSSVNSSGKVGVLVYTHFGDVDRCQIYLERFLGRFLSESETFGQHWKRLDEKGCILYGSPKQAVEKLKRLEACGVDQVLLAIDFGGMSHKETTSNLKRFAKSVMPHF